MMPWFKIKQQVRYNFVYITNRSLEIDLSVRFVYRIKKN